MTIEHPAERLLASRIKASRELLASLPEDSPDVDYAALTGRLEASLRRLVAAAEAVLPEAGRS